MRPPSGTQEIPSQVVLGNYLGKMSLSKQKRLLTWLSVQAEREFGIRPPGEGKGWWLVPLPPVVGMGWAAVAVGRSPARGAENNWRVLAFTLSLAPAGVADLKRLVGDTAFQDPAPTDPEGMVCGKEWLARVLAVSANQDEALARLWIILGRTNAFSFQP